MFVTSGVYVNVHSIAAGFAAPDNVKGIVTVPPGTVLADPRLTVAVCANMFWARKRFEMKNRIEPLTR